MNLKVNYKINSFPSKVSKKILLEHLIKLSILPNLEHCYTCIKETHLKYMIKKDPYMMKITDYYYSCSFHSQIINVSHKQSLTQSFPLFTSNSSYQETYQKVKMERRTYSTLNSFLEEVTMTLGATASFVHLSFLNLGTLHIAWFMQIHWGIFTFVQVFKI